MDIQVVPVLSEWHPTKNSTTPADHYKSSKEEVWWLGAECGHEWKARIDGRVIRGTGCLVCLNRFLQVGVNDLATRNPELVTSFMSDRNGKTVSEVLAGGRDIWWWVCTTCSHEWRASYAQRARTKSCEVCANLVFVSGVNDIATCNPDLVAEWHPTLNQLSPSEVLAGGTDKHWWLGECGHEWKSSYRHRADGAGCHVCAGFSVVAGFNDLASQHPDLAAEWHPTLNRLSSTEVYVNSGDTAWWLCENGHEWEQQIRYRSTSLNDCFECAKLNVEEEKSLAYTHPNLAAEWHPKLNGTLTANQISFGSKQKVWWLGECGHEWTAVLHSRTSGMQGCAVCRGLQITPGINDLTTTHPDLAAEWHTALNDITPDMVTAGSHGERVWQCNKNPLHIWTATPAKRSSGRNCPVCSGHKVISGVNDLHTLEPDLAAEWHPLLNGLLTPADVTGKGGRLKAWWLCEKGHEWVASVKSRITTDVRKGNGCPECWANSYSSAAERELANYVRSILPDTVEVKQNDRKLLRGMELDIYVPSKSLAIEFNGVYWHSEAQGKTRYYHHDKWLACMKKGIQLIQVWEDDWKRNPDQIKRMLAHKLGVTQELTIGARKTQVIELTKTVTEAFLNTHHIQGYASGSHYLGLQRKDTNEIVAVLVLKKQAGNVLNIIRYATSCNIPGGFTKLLKYAETVYQPASFLTFSDHSVSDGGLYEKNGFIVDKELKPDYMYLVDGVRSHKFGYRLKRFRSDPELDYLDGLSERELAALNGLGRVWDSGKTRWIKHVP